MTQAQVTLVNGVWSGRVQATVALAPGGKLSVFWNDLGASSETLALP